MNSKKDSSENAVSPARDDKAATSDVEAVEMVSVRMATLNGLAEAAAVAATSGAK